MKGTFGHFNFTKFLFYERPFCLLNFSASGSYFLKTNSKQPYAMGPMIEIELEVADKLDIRNNLR